MAKSRLLNKDIIEYIGTKKEGLIYPDKALGICYFVE